MRTLRQWLLARTPVVNDQFTRMTDEALARLAA